MSEGIIGVGGCPFRWFLANPETSCSRADAGTVQEAKYICYIPGLPGLVGFAVVNLHDL